MDRITRRRMIGSSLVASALYNRADAQTQPKLEEFKKLSSDISKAPANVTIQQFDKLSIDSLAAPKRASHDAWPRS